MDYLSILVNGERYTVRVLSQEPGRVHFTLNDRSYLVAVEKKTQAAIPEGKQDTAQAGLRTPGSSSKHKRSATKTEAGNRFDRGVLLSPIPGLVIELRVKVGDVVSVGDTLLRVEAMKMQNNITAQTGGTVREIMVKVGDEVRDGQPLLAIS